MANHKKKIFLLADSLVDLRFVYEILLKSYDVKWVFYNKKLKNDFLKLGYNKNDLIFVNKLNFLDFLKKIIFRIFKIEKFNYQNLLIRNIKKIDQNLKPDLWITDTGNILSKVEIETIKTTFKHSVPYKKFFLSENIFDYDYVFIPGEYHFNRIINFYKHKKTELKKKLMISPSPKILPYMKLKKDLENKKDFCKKYSLDPSQKIVVLATTYNSFKNQRFLPENFGEETLALKILCEIIAIKKKFNFIIKLHHYHFDKILNSRYSFLSDFKNVHIFKSNKNYDSLDSEEVFFQSDFVITDTSGVGPLCCYLDKKMIYLNPDPPFDWNSSDIEKDMRPGFILDKLGNASEIFDQYIKTPEAFSIERKKFTQSIFKYLGENSLDVFIYNIKKILNEKN